MVVEVTASKVSQCVKDGFERIKRFRLARVQFIRDYVGTYFAKESGLTGEYPINLVFLAIRILIPNLVMREGLNKVLTPHLAHKETAELLGLALDQAQRQMKLKNVLRAGLVDMCFGLSTFKTSIAASGNLLPIAPDINIDPGMVYTDLVSLDDLVFDPVCTNLSKAEFVGHRIEISRQLLLDDKTWDHDLIVTLPSAYMQKADSEAKDITQKNLGSQQMKELQDKVRIIELWIPGAQAVCYVPDPQQQTNEDFLKIQDYYGPAEGPYTFGSLTPPVPDNPFPVAPVGVWRDINQMANKLFTKLMNRADRQKDFLLYKPAYADVAQTIVDGMDGESAACDDPEAAKVVSFGTQSTEVDKMINQMSVWWNQLAGNPLQLAGITTSGSTGTATESSLLQSNLTIGIEDMRDIITDVNADISKKQGWFLMYDPMIKLPLYKRDNQGKEIQLYLTPEQRQGTWEEYTFSIVKRSTVIMEPNLRAKRIIDFYTNVLPGIVQSAQVMMQMGVEFNISRALMQAAEELGISENMVEVFNDPTFTSRLEVFMKMGPQKSEGMSLKAVAQNEGLPSKRTIPSAGTEMAQGFQEGAAPVQSAMRIM